MSILGAVKAAIGVGKKAKARKAAKAASSEQASQLKIKREGQDIERAGMLSNQAGERQSLASSFAKKNIAGGPAAAAQMKIQREGQERDLTQQGLGIQSTNRAAQYNKKVKKLGRLDVTSFF